MAMLVITGGYVVQYPAVPPGACPTPCLPDSRQRYVDVSTATWLWQGMARHQTTIAFGNGCLEKHNMDIW